MHPPTLDSDKIMDTLTTNDADNTPEGGLLESTCCRSFGRVMEHLERIIHEINNAHEGTGYSADALWLEEVRHHIHRLERERDSIEQPPTQPDAQQPADEGLDGAIC